MSSSVIVLFAVMLTASAAMPDFTSLTEDVTLREMFSRLMASTFQASQPESQMCNGRCLVTFGNEERLLDEGEEYIDPENPCERFVCQADGGLTHNQIECPEIDTCSDGEPPFKLPRQCCYSCGPGSLEPDILTEWLEWTECSKTCGRGARSRRRQCEIKEDGVLINCRGDTLMIEDCNPDPCPVPCEWKYGDFGECSVTCDEGVQQRFPMITQNASNGGEPCPPHVVNGEPDEIPCTEEDCPLCPPGETICLIEGHANFMMCLKDIDKDCVPDPEDNCRNISNTDQSDMDGDHVGDVCDNCINEGNPNQTNSDNDKTGDACDIDDDNDGKIDSDDNCQFKANADQRDNDTDKIGNVCDNCPAVKNNNQNDVDGDKVGNACDNCRRVYNPDQEEDAETRYGREECGNKPSELAMSMNDDDMTEDDKKGLAAAIMEKLLEMYYSN